MAQPLLQHVQRDAVDGGIDPEPVPQALGAALRRLMLLSTRSRPPTGSSATATLARRDLLF